MKKIYLNKAKKLVLIKRTQLPKKVQQIDYEDS